MKTELTAHRWVRTLAMAAAFLLLLTALPVTARADIGPKPSVQITFTGLEGETYYGTLLSEKRSTGPATAWDGDEAHAHYGEGEYDLWRAFVDYEDPDGFYFLQEYWDCSETDQLRWTYYPPTPFKILLYFPETGSFYVSPVYERYAFDSYYTVDLSALDPAEPLRAARSYDYTWEAVSLGVRIVATILLELAVALLFGYRGRGQLALLAGVNIITQVVLNVLLNVVNYRSGSMAFTAYYLLFEAVVFALEAAVYAVLLPRLGTGEQGRRGRAVLYALVANSASFGAGLWIAHRIPGIF